MELSFVPLGHVRNAEDGIALSYNWRSRVVVAAEEASDGVRGARWCREDGEVGARSYLVVDVDEECIVKDVVRFPPAVDAAVDEIYLQAVAVKEGRQAVGAVVGPRKEDEDASRGRGRDAAHRVGEGRRHGAGGAGEVGGRPGRLAVVCRRHGGRWR